MKLVLISAFSLLAACSTMKNRELHDTLVKNAAEKKYPAAAATAAREDFYPEERSALLRRLERASAYYYNGELYRSLLEFDAAKGLSDELYTKSISAKLASALDSNKAEFYGERYERSNIRFWQALLHLRLAAAGKYEAWRGEDGAERPEKILSPQEKRQHLLAARSVMQEWESIFPQFELETEGKPGYKADMMSHLLGAAIHEQTGAPADRQIALGLYRRAKEVAFRNYNVYPSFNKKHKEFADGFGTFHAMERREVEQKYVEQSADGKELTHYIDRKIGLLEKNRPDNLVVIVKDGLVAEKKSREYKLDFRPDEMARLAYLSAYISAASGGSGRAVSNAAFISFATTYLLKDITYDMPYIEYRAPRELAASIAGADGKRVPVPLALASPLSDIAYKEINDKIPAERAALAARLTAEYIAAAATAYFSYANMKKSAGNSPWGELAGIAAGVGAFKGLSAAINASNKADLRQWKLLPSDIRIGGASLAPGDYTLEITEGGKVVARESVKVGEGASIADITL